MITNEKIFVQTALQHFSRKTDQGGLRDGMAHLWLNNLNSHGCTDSGEKLLQKLVCPLYELPEVGLISMSPVVLPPCKLSIEKSCKYRRHFLLHIIV